MLMPPFNIYFETFCQDLKHYFWHLGLIQVVDAWALCTLLRRYSLQQQCLCSHDLCNFKGEIDRKVVSTPWNDEFPAKLSLWAVHCVFTKEEGTDGMVPSEAVPQQLLSHVLICEGSVRELEAVCPHNYNVCRADLLSINPAVHKHSVSPIVLRINLVLLVPRTISVPQDYHTASL